MQIGNVHDFDFIMSIDAGEMNLLALFEDGEGEMSMSKYPEKMIFLIIDSLNVEQVKELQDDHVDADELRTHWFVMPLGAARVMYEFLGMVFNEEAI